MPERGQTSTRAAEGAAGGPAIPAGDSLLPTRGLAAERYRSLFDSLREGMAYCRMIFEGEEPVDWLYLDVNPAFSALTGLGDVCGRRVSEVIPELREQNPEIFATYGRVVATGDPEQFEVLVRPLGIWLAISVIRPEPGCFVALFENISARRQAEAELRRSEGFLRSSIDSLSESIAVVDAAGRILLVNEAWRQFAAANGADGCSLVCEGANYLETCDNAAAAGSEDAERFAAQLRALLAGELERFDFEYECHAPDCQRWFVARVTRAEAGPGRAVVSHENTTEQMLAERRLHESVEQCETILDHSPDAIFVNMDDRIVLANRQAARLFGTREPEELLGRSPIEFTHPDGRALARERIEALRRSGKPNAPVEQRILRLDGSTVDVEVAASPIHRHGRLALLVTMRDISERRRAEQLLHHQEAMLREAGAIAHVGGWEFDPGTGKGSWTEEVAHIHEVDPKDVPDRGFGLSFYVGESRARIEAALKAAVAHGEPYDLELEMRTAKGARKFVRTICHPDVREGRVVRVRGSIQDITSRVLAEQALVAERSRLRTVIDTIPDKVWLKDPDGVYLGCNPAFERMLGRKEADIVDRSDFDFFRPEVAEEFRRHDRVAIAAGKPAVNEEWVQSATDGPELLETIKTPVLDPQGRLLGVLGIARNVTEARATAESLRQSEERLRLLIEHAPAALAMFDTEMRYLAASRRWRTDFGLGEARLEGRDHYEVFPEIGDDLKEVHRRSLAGEVLRGDGDRFRRLDGREQWVKWETHPWRDASGGVAGIVVFTEDITERRLTQDRLAESEAHYRALAETTFDWIWEVDSDGRYTFVSPRVAQLLGYSPEEVLGKRPFDFMPEGEAQRVRELFEEFVARQEPFARLENVNAHRDGRRIVLESSGVPFFDADGKLRGYRGMDRDITARKQAERRSTTQAAVSRVLAQATSLAEAAPGVLAAIGDSEGWLCGAVWEVDDERRRLRSVATWVKAGFQAERFLDQTRTLQLAEGEGFPGLLWRSGRVEVWRDLPAKSSFLRRDVASVAGLQEAIGFPIRFGEEVLGVVEFFDSGISTLEPELVEVFDALGRQLGQFVERTRSTATIARFVAGSPAVIYALRVLPEGLKLAWFSANLANMTGWRSVEIEHYSWWLENIHPDDRARVLAANAVPYDRSHQVIDFRFRHQDGRYLWIRDEKRMLFDLSGNPSEVVGSWTDITDRVELEEKLRVAQRLEAIGRLAGGVAHDFNNMLMVISGNGEMLDRAMPAEGSERALLGEIREAAERSAGLTRQLLAFSRTQVLAPRVHSLAELVSGIETMLRRLIGEDVRLVCDLEPSAGHVLVDRGQLEQVIVNLAVNARDAMPRGGTLTVATSAIDLDESSSRRLPGMAPGSFARLEVRDTGCGMRPEVLEKIFEPFFTTKPVGKGTGLGLSTVFGIVKQSGGHIEATSTEGEGSSFIIYLPRVTAPAKPPAEREAASEAVTAKAAHGRETVLVVEDESGVRRVVRLALAKQGYRLLVASGGREAVAIAEQYPEPIDLLLTDLVMPEMSGSELAGILRARRPGLAVLLMSGYVEDDFVRHGVVSDEVAFLHKPFTLAELTGKVRETLDALST